ncbi:hypothetical protein F4560_005392 [Saccharothrix ecbatanensis]|uniref:Uncharacterized protein n=1 Tax=Saccharothrix ecbatanensis TaxID=1105145 RepID=A0A7W9HNL8_9PSEU|nr:hypothetical protein [Saccharothrix ecbatanensis]
MYALSLRTIDATSRTGPPTLLLAGSPNRVT